MVTYYCCCHPTGGRPQQNKEHMAYWFKRLKNTQVPYIKYFKEADLTSFNIRKQIFAQNAMILDSVLKRKYLITYETQIQMKNI